MNVTEKSAYLKGLAEGLGLDPQKPETKIINALLELVSDMSQKITELEHDVEVLNDYADELDEDLGFVEEFLYEDDEDDEDFDDEDDEDDEEIEYDGIIYDAVCPVCGEEISFGQETLEEGSVNCPGCGELLEFDLSEEEDD